MSARREQHVYELAAELGVTIELRRGPSRSVSGRVLAEGRAQPSGTAWVSNWDGRSQLGYFVALHELGHHAYGHPTSNGLAYRTRYLDRIVEAEAEAWDWALKHARERPGPVVIEAIKNDWLGSYVRNEGTRTAGSTYARVASTVGLAGAA